MRTRRAAEAKQGFVGCKPQPSAQAGNRKYKCPNGRCIHELAARKDELTAGKTAQAHAKAVVVTVTIRWQLFTQACVQFPQTAVAVPADDKDQQKNARRCGERDEL